MARNYVKHNLRTPYIIVFALALLAPPLGTTQTTPSETIVVDASAPAHPLPHFWEHIFGSERAAVTMRESYRQDLKEVKKITGVEYIRFHALFHDEMGIYDEDGSGKPIYNFSYVDQVYDGLLDNGVRPFVELSFMPNKLAASQKLHPSTGSTVRLP